MLRACAVEMYGYVDFGMKVSWVGETVDESDGGGSAASALTADGEEFAAIAPVSSTTRRVNFTGKLG